MSRGRQEPRHDLGPLPSSGPLFLRLEPDQSMKQADDQTTTLYNPDFEHDGCGIGFIASTEGERSHRLVRLALRALVNMTHRGAVSADAASGDGAGITLEIPRELLGPDARALGLAENRLDRLAVAMVYLPQSEEAAALSRGVVEDVALRSGLEVLGWRIVPTDHSALGELAAASAPRVEQLLMVGRDGLGVPAIERALYLARRRAETAFEARCLDGYIVSMSAKTVVYKGLLGAEELDGFYPDLSDERTTTRLAIFHQRFATNTLPNWKLAQPFRMVAHNGEINTLIGNRNWMTAREPELTSGIWGDDVADLTPVIKPIGSDTASLDEALELLVLSGRDLVESMAILVPEAWESMPGIGQRLRSFYQYHACLTEPWDGPAALAVTDGTVVAAALDRNGLRPARYKVTTDGLVIMSSEAGVLDLASGDVLESGRVGPGEVFAVDSSSGLILRNEELKQEMAGRRPYAQWLDSNLQHLKRAQWEEVPTPGRPPVDDAQRSNLHVLHGYTQEELKLVLQPMAQRGKEPIGSMGDDTAPTVLTSDSRPLYAYFRQRFAQVTNPAIDPIREKSVMSLDTYLGRRASLLETLPEAAKLVHLQSPVLTDEELESLRNRTTTGLKAVTLSATFDVSVGVEALSAGLDALCAAALEAADGGNTVIILSDRGVNEGRAPIPMLLATSTVHHHLIRSGRRMRASLVAEAGDARDVHQIAALIGFGASAVNPYLALETVRSFADDEEPGDSDYAAITYLQAAEAGLLKVMSKIGITSVSSYHGAQVFEALGLGEELIARCFPGTTSRIGGIGLADIAADVLERHFQAFESEGLQKGGWYRYRRNSEYHANEPPVWRALQSAVQGGGREAYQTYVDLVHNRPATALRDLLDITRDREAIPLDEVEPLSGITKRFQTGAMSLGALSAEAHEDIARAMNQLGALSNTGEGGEDPRRYSPDGDMRDANSSVKQVASGRFGVTAAYLASAQELEIKISQGSKPGEGGQLPGKKVSSYIAELRHVYPGTPLISPPPHHDIYSIEDLAQLIFDLKMVNPRARVAVKLVSVEGVGTIAAGVAKAHADTIHISGADGGTGASPLSSIKYAGAPWELGLAEAQQTLVRNGLRQRVTLTTDGGLHTGRDVIKAALLGAERFGFGTTALIAIGCKMARQCHSNTCPVGIATQAEDLRQKYFGTPEMLVEFFTLLADEVREILGWMGYTRLDEIIGRADLLNQLPPEEGTRWAGVDLSRLIAMPAEGWVQPTPGCSDPVGVSLDDAILADAGHAIVDGLPFSAEYPIRNTDRTVAGRVSGRIASIYGNGGLPPGTVDLRFKGSAGQSFGAWLVQGVHLRLTGEANDYVGKGMSGGEIVIRPDEAAGFARGGATVAGNTVLYGATGGMAYIAGQAGERFAVRNSGAGVVVEGIGMHGCEYMTGGVVVVLGETGRNFGAGMSGGLAFVLDEHGSLPSRLNPSLVAYEVVRDRSDVDLLRAMIAGHYTRTGSPRARSIMAGWPRKLPMFWRVAPRAAVGSTVRSQARDAFSDALVATVSPTTLVAP